MSESNDSTRSGSVGGRSAQSEADAGADMVELEVDENGTAEMVPADALEDALDALPDQPTDEVAMVTDTIVVAGDGDNDSWVRVMSPSNIVNEDAEGRFFIQTMPYFRNKIDEGRSPTFVEYVDEEIMGSGTYEVEETDQGANVMSYIIESHEIEAMIEDDRIEIHASSGTEYNDSYGSQLTLHDTAQ